MEQQTSGKKLFWFVFLSTKNELVSGEIREKQKREENWRDAGDSVPYGIGCVEKNT
jgi:hypothetical protein